jgi:uncharacterized protein (TIGR02996 family)
VSMNTLDAMLRAVLIDPADDTARLAYADCLEERGEEASAARAGYIRGSVHSPEPRHPSPHRFTSGELPNPDLSHYPTVTDITGLKAWEGYDQPHAGRWYHRGFVWRVAMPVTVFMRAADVLFRHHPIVEVELYDRGPNTVLAASDQEGHGAWWYMWDLCELSDITPGTPLPGYLPRDLWAGPPVCRKAEFLPHQPTNVTVWNAERFPTVQLANLALSRRCVNYGRELAGLPPLQWPAGDTQAEGKAT